MGKFNQQKLKLGKLLLSSKFGTVYDDTSSIPGIALTASFFNELCNLLSSVVAVLCTTFFFLRGVPCKYGPQIF